MRGWEDSVFAGVLQHEVRKMGPVTPWVVTPLEVSLTMRRPVMVK